MTGWETWLQDWCGAVVRALVRTRAGLLGVSVATVFAVGLTTTLLAPPTAEKPAADTVLTLQEFESWLDSKVELERNAVRAELGPLLLSREGHEQFVVLLSGTIRSGRPWMPTDAPYQEYLGYLIHTS